MGIIDRLAKRLGYAKLSGPVEGAYPLAYAAGERFNYLDPVIYGNQADLYRTSSWIGTATQILSQACASVPFGVYNRNKEGRDEIINHDFELLLGKPNPLQSRFEFLEASFSNYRLTGNSYTWINSASETDQPAELWTIQSDQIEPVPDEKMFLKGYIYRPGDGLELPLEPWEVIHVKTYNPRSMFVGLSLIESIAIQAQADLGKVKREAKISGSENGRMPGILAFADKFQPAEWQNMQDQIEDKANKMRSYMLLNNVKQGGVNWINTAITQEQAQFIQQRQFTKEEIFDRVAPGLASMLAVNATEANSKSGKATFSEYAIWPLLVAFAEKWTNELLPRYGDNLVGEFEDVRMKDRVLELSEIAEYGKTHTVEEVRKKFYNDKPLGDKRDNLLPAQINAATGEGDDEPEPEQVPTQLQQPAPMQPVDEQPEQETPSESEQTEDTDEQAEVKRWKRVARKAIKAGRSIPDFVTDIIPATRANAIRAKLAAVKSVDEIDAAFETPQMIDRAEELVQRLEKIMFVKYSPDQPRDDLGMWTSGGSGGGGGGGGSASGGGTLAEQYGANSAESRSNRARGEDKKTSEYVDSAYKLGQEAASRGYSSMRQAVMGEYWDKIENYDMLGNVAFEAGLRGNERPVYATGWRFGDIPDSGSSMNFAEGRMEVGVSVVEIDGGGRTSDMLSLSFIAGKNRPIVDIEGYVNPNTRGSDGEPLVIRARVIP